MNNKFFQFLGIAKKSGNVIEGYNKCEEAIKGHKLNLVIISKECSDNTKNKFTKYCKDEHVQIIQGICQADLGKFIGRTGINIIGIKDLNISQKLMDLWKSEE